MVLIRAFQTSFTTYISQKKSQKSEYGEKKKSKVKEDETGNTCKKWEVAGDEDYRRRNQ